MLSFYREGQRQGVLVTCDECGDPILEAGTGSYLYRKDGEGQPLDGVLVFVHKFPCDMQWCAPRGGRGEWGWGELSRLPSLFASGLALGRTGRGRRVLERLSGLRRAA